VDPYFLIFILLPKALNAPFPVLYINSILFFFRVERVSKDNLNKVRGIKTKVIRQVPLLGGGRGGF
jgi:hypothetical protein